MPIHMRRFFLARLGNAARSERLEPILRGRVSERDDGVPLGDFSYVDRHDTANHPGRYLAWRV